MVFKLLFVFKHLGVLCKGWPVAMKASFSCVFLMIREMKMRRLLLMLALASLGCGFVSESALAAGPQVKAMNGVLVALLKALATMP